MTLDEVRVEIDSVDTKVKPLFLKRMECAKAVAEVKSQTGGDVFVLERELAIIEKRAGDVQKEVYDEYVMFLRTLMSISRRYQYGFLKGMQDNVINDALAKSGLDSSVAHENIEISFTCDKATSDLNLYLNMAKLNDVSVNAMSLKTDKGIQKVIIEFDGTINDSKVRQLLCQIAKESDNFKIIDLK